MLVWVRTVSVSLASMTGEEPAPNAPGPESRDEQLARALTLIGSPLTPIEVRRMIAAARVPSEVVQAVLASCPNGPTNIASVERCIPVLMNLWNDIQASGPPRPPEPARRTKVGANERCPCGSGKKYKRCCMHDESLH